MRDTETGTRKTPLPISSNMAITYVRCTLVHSYIRTFVQRTYAKLQTTVYPSKFHPHASKPRQNPFQTIPNILFFDNFFFWSPNFSIVSWLQLRFYPGFGGAALKWTAPNCSDDVFASDASILRSVRPNFTRNASEHLPNMTMDASRRMLGEQRGLGWQTGLGEQRGLGHQSGLG